MRHLLKNLRESFNFILLDSPPAIAVSDAAVLSVMCDGVLLVFHGQKTTTASARQAMARLDTVRASFLGVILNGIDLANPEYVQYRHYYGSDYASVGKPENDRGRLVPAPGQEELDDAELRLEELGPGTVPQDFFDQMTAKLSEAAGPMAPLIIQEQIALLRGSTAAFPKNRLKELIERVRQKILNEALRNDFDRNMRAHLMSL
jgi:Mrp family chromosome partitioning ATPase